MLVQVDLCLQRALEEELRLLRTDATPLREVFEGLPEEDIEVISRTFASLVAPVKLGYPRDVTELPGLFVTLGSMSEAEQTIGEGFGEEVFRHIANGVEGDPLYWEDRSGTFMQSTVRVCCWTENANLTVWLQNVVTWVLLRRRDELTDVGLLEQRIGATDFEPLPRWFPSFAYRRDVTFSAKHAATYVNRVRPIANVDAEATVQNQVFTVQVGR